MREIPEFTKNEVRAAIDSLKKGKASDSNGKPSRRHRCSTRNREEAIPRQKLERFVRLFSGDGWIWWNRPSTEEQAHQSSVRRGRRQSVDDSAKPSERAVSLGQMGEVTRARQARHTEGFHGFQEAPDSPKRRLVQDERISAKERFVLDVEKFLMVGCEQ